MGRPPLWRRMSRRRRLQLLWASTVVLVLCTAFLVVEFAVSGAPWKAVTAAVLYGAMTVSNLWHIRGIRRERRRADLPSVGTEGTTEP